MLGAWARVPLLLLAWALLLGRPALGSPEASGDELSDEVLQEAARRLRAEMEEQGAGHSLVQEMARAAQEDFNGEGYWNDDGDVFRATELRELRVKSLYGSSISVGLMVAKTNCTNGDMEENNANYYVRDQAQSTWKPCRLPEEGQQENLACHFEVLAPVGLHPMTVMRRDCRPLSVMEF